jgi:hypothetical protein
MWLPSGDSRAEGRLDITHTTRRRGRTGPLRQETLSRPGRTQHARKNQNGHANPPGKAGASPASYCTGASYVRTTYINSTNTNLRFPSLRFTTRTWFFLRWGMGQGGDPAKGQPALLQCLCGMSHEALSTEVRSAVV